MTHEPVEMDDLTPAQIKALKQIGFGVSGRRGGFYDEVGERLDGRSLPSLIRLGLVFYYTRGGAPLTGALELTDEGYELLEVVRKCEEDRELERKRRLREW